LPKERDSRAPKRDLFTNGSRAESQCPFSRDAHTTHVVWGRPRSYGAFPRPPFARSSAPTCPRFPYVSPRCAYTLCARRSRPPLFLPFSFGRRRATCRTGFLFVAPRPDAIDSSCKISDSFSEHSATGKSDAYRFVWRGIETGSEKQEYTDDPNVRRPVRFHAKNARARAIRTERARRVPPLTARPPTRAPCGATAFPVRVFPRHAYTHFAYSHRIFFYSSRFTNRFTREMFSSVLDDVADYTSAVTSFY